MVTTQLIILFLMADEGVSTDVSFNRHIEKCAVVETKTVGSNGKLVFIYVPITYHETVSI